MVWAPVICAESSGRVHSLFSPEHHIICCHLSSWRLKRVHCSRRRCWSLSSLPGFSSFLGIFSTPCPRRITCFSVPRPTLSVCLGWSASFTNARRGRSRQTDVLGTTSAPKLPAHQCSLAISLFNNRGGVPGGSELRLLFCFPCT